MFGDIFKKEKTEYKKMPFYILKDNPEKLEEHKQILLDRLFFTTGTHRYDEIYKFSFDFLKENPISYDGSSGDQEFSIIEEDGVEYRYDIPSEIHDVASGVGYDRDMERMKKANKLFKIMNKDMHISYLNAFKRNLVGLWIVNKIRLWNRKITKTTYPITNNTHVFEKLIDELI